MAAFSTLSVPNQTLYLTHMQQVRGAVGALARIAAQLDALNIQWQNTIATLNTSLDAALIPDISGVPGAGSVILVSGLAGASPLLPSQVATMCGTNVPAFLTTYNSSNARALYTLFSGPINVIGT